jgi:hypothetical protein
MHISDVCIELYRLRRAVLKGTLNWRGYKLKWKYGHYACQSEEHNGWYIVLRQGQTRVFYKGNQAV